MEKIRYWIEALLFMAVMSLMVYLGTFSENEGLNNIGLTGLWIVALLLLLFVLTDGTNDKKEPTKKVPPTKAVKIVGRTWFASIILALLYQGHIVLGVIYFAYMVSKVGKTMKAEISA